jgi:hypothetical protein
MTTPTATESLFEVPEADRAAYDAIPDQRIAADIAAYWRSDPRATQEGAALVAHRRRLELVAASRAANARAEADTAAHRWARTCGAEGGGGPLCRQCRLVRDALDTEAALALPTTEGRDRREAVARYVTESEASARKSAAANQEAILAAMTKARAARGLAP